MVVMEVGSGAYDQKYRGSLIGGKVSVSTARFFFLITSVED